MDFGILLTSGATLPGQGDLTKSIWDSVAALESSTGLDGFRGAIQSMAGKGAATPELDRTPSIVEAPSSSQSGGLAEVASDNQRLPSQQATAHPTAVDYTNPEVKATDDPLTGIDAGAALASDNVKVNFQPDSAPVPDGYIKDTGQAYKQDRGYGWVHQDSLSQADPKPLDITPNTRDRNREGIDQRLNTLIHMQYPKDIFNPTAVKIPAAWEHTLPNGKYSVTVSVGDPDYDDSRHTINVEGVKAIEDFQESPKQDYKQATVEVSVTDGKLTIDAIGGTNTKLNYLEIKSVSTNFLNEELYPRGGRFPVGLYSVRADDMQNVAKDGANLVQSYSDDNSTAEQKDWLAAASDVGLQTLTNINIDIRDGNRTPTKTATKKAQTTIKELAALDGVGWWNLPEEQRWWHPDEMEKVKTLSKHAHTLDPKDRPVFMYIPGHYGSESIEHYVPYLDIIGTGAYTEYQGMPHSWMRWRIESQIDAIQDAGYAVDQKTPIAILGMFPEKGAPDPTPQGLSHDAFAAIAAGARGLLIYSYFYRNELDGDVYPAVQRIMKLIGGEGIGETVIEGKRLGDLKVTALNGPQKSPSFTPYGSTESITYPSVRAVAWDRAGMRLVIAVNSSTKPVTARIGGLPTTASRAVVIDENRRVAINAGKLEDRFGALEVHLYRVPIQP